MGVIIMHKSVGDFTLCVQITVAAVYEAQDILNEDQSIFISHSVVQEKTKVH